MTAEIFRSSARLTAPELPTGEVRLEAPPAMPDPPKGGIRKYLKMAPMLLMPMGMGVGMMASRGGALSSLSGGMMGMGYMGMMARGMMGQQGPDPGAINDERSDYLRYLDNERRKVRAAAEEQRIALEWPNPEPDALVYQARGPRLWERRSGDVDFGEVRIGRGPQAHALDISAPEVIPLEELDPVCAKALRRFVHTYAKVPDLPLAVSLRAFARMLIDGDPDTRRGLARSIIGQCVTAHSPEYVKIAVCCSPERLPDWEWLKWLPHNHHPTIFDSLGPLRMFAQSASELERDIAKELLTDRGRFEPHATATTEEPFLILIIDGADVLPSSRLANAGYSGVITLDVDGGLAWRNDQLALRLRAVPGDLSVAVNDRLGGDLEEVLGEPDSLDLAQARALAKSMAKWQVGYRTESGPASAARSIDLCDLLEIENARTFDPAEYWKKHGLTGRLRVPIGLDDNGAPIELDIRESAQGGMGPHGMLVGATGSGKSELLRTLVTAMAVRHSSEFLNFVLVDFKGGATFVGLDRLPHTSALITNLADELPLVDRMQDAIQGELVRRQELLRATGYASLRDHQQARISGVDLEPLPTLFLVIDEFSELLAVRRDFINLFVMVGRLGRSLGVHLLLATQRIEEGRVTSLEGHLSYRLGLKTFSASESRAVLGMTDAYTTNLDPGEGFLKTSQSGLTKFRGAYVSGALPSEDFVEAKPLAKKIRTDLYDFGPGYVPLPEPEEEPETGPVIPGPDESIAREDTMLHVLIDRLAGSGPEAHRVWLPPLKDPQPLDALVGPIGVHPQRGVIAHQWNRGSMTAPVGIIDKPFEQRWETMVAKLDGAHGNIGIVGGAQSGKSTMLRTLIMSLALLNTADEVKFYCLDFSSGGLAALAGLPHVGSVGARRDPDLVTRTLIELVGLVSSREALFAELGIDSMAQARKLRTERKPATGDDLADIFLVVDGWFTIRQEFEALEPYFQELASRGLSYGVHLVITSNRWSEIRTWMRDALGTKFELHLGDRSDSVVGSRAAANVPAIPGRGLTLDSMHFLAGIPRIDGSSDVESLPQATATLVQQIATHWKGRSAPAVRTLPALLRMDELPAPQGGGTSKQDLKLAIGVNEANVAPHWWDFGQTPHLTIFGDTETGKTAFLRLLLQGIVQQYPPEEVRILLADFRRELHDTVPEPYRLGYVTHETGLSAIVKEAAGALTARIPASDLSLEALKRRDWWKGPRIFVVVDDLDLIASGGFGAASPLAAFAPLMPHGPDIGLHMIVARSTVAGSRGANDPVVKQAWSLGNPALLLSCPKEESTIFGSTRPRVLPPGRAQLITRRGASLVQLGFAPDNSTDTTEGATP